MKHVLMLLVVIGMPLGCSEGGSASPDACDPSEPESCNSEQSYCSAAGQCEQCPAGLLNCDGDNDNACEATGSSCSGLPTDVATPERYNVSWAAARCAGIMKCCEDPSVIPASLEACRQDWEKAFRLVLLDDLPDCVRYSEEAAKAVLEEMNQETESCTLAVTKLPSAAFVGTSGIGASCEHTALDFNDCCAAGTYCNFDGALTGTCKARIAEGKPCDAEEPNISCLGYCADGTCHARQPDGSACDMPSQCTSDFCSPEGICRQITSAERFCPPPPVFN